MDITSTDFTYTGQRALPDTGLMDYKARFYSPSLKRFIQPDTIIPGVANSQSWNRYSYTYNNPIRFTDPSGHSSSPVELSSGGDTVLIVIVIAFIVTALIGRQDNERRHGASTETDCLATLAQCFKQHDLKNFGENQTIDGQEFNDMLDAINDDLHSKWRTRYDPARADYDTPFFNGDKRGGDDIVDDNNVYINDKRSKQSAVNYVAQGMYSAHTGQSLDDSLELADNWNKRMYNHGATEDEKYWVKYGYNHYNSINKKITTSGASKKIERMLAME